MSPLVPILPATVSDNYGMNSKKSLRFSKLVDNIDIAIEEEKNLNTDVKKAYGRVSSNIGEIISLLREKNEIK